jgi:hypothetical protein
MQTICSLKNALITNASNPYTFIATEFLLINYVQSYEMESTPKKNFAVAGGLI